MSFWDNIHTVDERAERDATEAIVHMDGLRNARFGTGYQPAPTERLEFHEEIFGLHELDIRRIHLRIARTWMRIGIGLLILCALQLPGAIKSLVELLP